MEDYRELRAKKARVEDQVRGKPCPSCQRPTDPARWAKDDWGRGDCSFGPNGLRFHDFPGLAVVAAQVKQGLIGGEVDGGFARVPFTEEEKEWLNGGPPPPAPPEAFYGI